MEGLRSVIDDIVKCSTEGEVIRNAEGEEMLLFLNVVGYVADYHETGHALDITGQNGKAPCHLCAFLRYNGHPSTSSRYAHSTVIHSADTCYAHTGGRTESVRACNLSKVEFSDIGLNPSEEARKKNSPLQELYLKLKEAVRRTEIPLTSDDAPVVNPRFDPYKSVLVSPDHVLFGVTSNALNYAFAALPSRSRREQVDAKISSCVRWNGLAKESQIFNLSKCTVHAASISTRFATLLVAPEVFKEVLDHCKNRGEVLIGANTPTETSLANLTKLRNLVTATYWFPNISVDGENSVTYFNSNGGRAHLRRLELLCEDYITNLNNICKRFPEARAELDRPNVHRGLELFKHSIPAMGLVRHFAELVFETAHQPLKRAMQRSNFRDSHLQSSQTSIVDDWKRRMQCVFNSYTGDREAESECNAEMELLKLLCGRRTEAIDAIWSDNVLREQLATTLRSKQLLTILNSKPSKLNETKWLSAWILSKPYCIPKESTELTAISAVARDLADNFLVQEGRREMKVFLKASRVRITAGGGRVRTHKPRSHEILRRGAVIQARVWDEHSPCLITSMEKVRNKKMCVTMRLRCCSVSARNRRSIADHTHVATPPLEDVDRAQPIYFMLTCPSLSRYWPYRTMSEEWG